MSQQRLSFHRRNLHKIPEIGSSLDKTCEYVLSHLAPLSAEVFCPTKSSVVAFFDMGKKNTTAFRADMDALPIDEKNTFDFVSEHKGCMHACGHDGHTATLLTFAERIEQIKQEIENNILLIFQPDEELNGGAKPICETGLLEKYNVTKVFAFHIWPFNETGKIMSRPLEFMARTAPVYIDIKGKSSHVAEAEKGHDALYAAAKFITTVYEIEKNEVALGVYRLLKFGISNSGTANNAISSFAHLEGTLRTFDEDINSFLTERIHDTARKIEAETGCIFNINIGGGYPAVINDPLFFEQVEQHLGKGYIEILDNPTVTGEDFSEYLLRSKGTMFFVGSGKDKALHFDDFDFDENAMSSALNLFEKLCFMK